MSGDDPDAVDPAIAMWAGAIATWIAAKSGKATVDRAPRTQAGRPAERALDAANAALVRAFPQLADTTIDGPSYLALLEGIYGFDLHERRPWPGRSSRWTPYADADTAPAGRQRNAVMARARKRIRRAKALIDS